MDFKISILGLVAVLMSACTPYPSTENDQNLIGVPLEKVSTVNSAQGDDSEQVMIFDETVRKIHQFDLDTMTYKKSYAVKNPDRKHSVVGHENGNYVIDFCEKNLTIYTQAGLVQENPIELQGQPLSAAFLSTSNLLVVYDDLNSVGIVGMNNQGEVVGQPFLGGSLMANSQTITSGDLLKNGTLVLALTGQIIALVDVGQTLQQQKWVYTHFTTTLPAKISWMAPVSDNDHQIFVKSGNDLAIIDLQTHAVVDSVTITNSRFEKLSKSSDAHVVTRNWSNLGEIEIFYPRNSKIESRLMQKQDLYLVSSHLNLAKDQWNFVTAAVDSTSGSIFNNVDDTKMNRTLRSIRLSDMLAVQKRAIADKSQVSLSNSFIFHLFPSELGYATRVDIRTGEQKEAKFFNMGHL